MNSFPDLHHLLRLRNDLWKTPGYGQAAVMVGSGFSLNAEPIAGENRKFPLWRDLAIGMFDKLYPANGSDSHHVQKRAQALAGSGGIALASEYEAAFGRQAFDQMLIASIPDHRYMPGELHRLLLELPWADVFTTNYDTLLERTPIDDRYYQLILTAEDLPGSAHPRIIKLHGSFPSQRPFIMTAEDYRTYPRKFAPFVNTVQQSLMENTLVLIGFSGDDPNFLYWSGWVRDELGVNAPRMYLCGVLNLTDPQKRLLEQRGVVPIDLTPVIGNTAQTTTKSIHALALEWLLLSLKNGQPSNPLNWPAMSQTSPSQPDYLPPLLAPAHHQHQQALDYLQPNVAFKDYLPTLLKAWRAEREHYPGWLVTPHENRHNVWQHTYHWIAPVFHQSEAFDPKLRLALFHEMNWRLERVLCPLFLDWVKIIEETLEMNTLDQIKDSSDFSYLEEAWVALAFAVTREAREDFDAVRHDRWMDRLLPISKQRPEWQSRWHYEHCLHSLWRLDQRETRKRVEAWRPSPDLLAWQIRRAAILAEIGDLSEAERIASDTLRRVRDGLRGRQQKIELLSLEGWLMRLLGNVKQGFLNMRADSEWSRFRDRWLQLIPSRCDPWQETEALGLSLQFPNPPFTPSVEEKTDFDYQVIRTRYSGDGLAPILPAFALLRIYEDAGLPMQAGIVSLLSSGVENACRWIMPNAPLWASATLIRAHKNKPLEDTFDRFRVATLNSNEVEVMRDWLMTAIQAAVDLLPLQATTHGQSFSERVLDQLVDLLSRLCIRLSSQQLEHVFRLALQLHMHPSVQLHVAHHDVCRPFFRRIFDAANEELLASWLPSLLALSTMPMFAAKQNSWGDRQWPDPFYEIDADRLKQAHAIVASGDVKRRVDELIYEAGLQTEEARKRAINRLWILSEAKLLSSRQNEAFGKALWAQVNAETGLPEHTDFYAHAFLNLPAPNRKAAVTAVRHWLLARPILHRYVEKQQPDGHKGWQIQNYLRKNPTFFDVVAATRAIEDPPEGRNLIDWTLAESVVLLKKAVDWWDGDKRGLKIQNPFHDADELRRTAKELVLLFRSVVMPRLPRAATNEWKTLERVLQELEDNKISVAECLPASLIVWPERKDEIANRIRDALTEGDEDYATEAMKAIKWWALFSLHRKGQKLPRDLIDEVCHRISIRELPALKEALICTARIVRRASKLLSVDQIGALCLGLGHLLDETRLATPKKQLALSSNAGRIPLNKRPLYRTLSARLAFELHRLCQNRKRAIPPVLEQWKLACEQDPLPEVRRQWREWGAL
jgi:hypothetical protein